MNLIRRTVSLAVIFTHLFSIIEFQPFHNTAQAAVAPLPIVTGTPAGYLAGQFSVNESGSAVYNLPLATPPGTSGVLPQLSLTYNSNGQNGLLGIGWSLKGLSGISRCPATLAQDGMIDGVDFDSSDKFCLDGQRLVAVVGSYGASGTEYRTENETFSQIISYGSAGSGPSYFTVKTKSGLIYTYGNTPDARIEAQGRSDVLAWNVNKIEDVVGNFLTVSYFEDSAIGESYPTRIDYTGNTAKGLAPYNSVRFEYEARSDSIPQYFATSLMKLTKRLKKVNIFTDTSLAWSYQLTYEMGTVVNRSRLIEIKECDSSNVCVSPTQLTWTEGSLSFAPQTLWFNVNGQIAEGNRPIGDSAKGLGTNDTLLDMNGDGRPDRVTQYSPPLGQYGLFVALNNGNGFGPQVKWWVADQNIGNRPIELDADGGRGMNNTLIDVNGDGLPDRAAHYNYQTRQYGLWVALNNGNGFNPQTLWWAAGKDLGNRPVEYSNKGYGVNFSLMDINGDGRADRLGSTNYDTSQIGLVVALNTGSGFGPKTMWWPTGQNQGNRPIETSDAGRGTNNTLIDMNGDGLADRVSHYNYQTSQYGMWVALNNGNGFNPQTLWWAALQNQGNRPMEKDADGRGFNNTLIDMNGDGLPDRADYYNYQTRQFGLWIALNTGSGFGPQQLWWNNGQLAEGNRPIGESAKDLGTNNALMDFNGDGLPDRVAVYNIQNGQYGLWVAINNGTGFDPQTKWWTANHNAGDRPVELSDDGRGVNNTLVDMNGDGFLDRVGYYNFETRQYGLWVALNNGKPPLIETITPGHSTQVLVKYRPLSDSTNYVRNYDAVYPQADVQGPLFVVDSVQTSNGIGGTSRVTYSYDGLKTNLLGRGFCGFRKIIMTSQQTGIKTSTFYLQEFPFQALPTKTEITLPDGTLLKRTTDTWDVRNFPNGTYFPFVRNTLALENEIDGTLVKTTTTNKTFDDFGNPTLITVDYSDGNKETTTSTYTNDTAKWFLGRLARTEVTKQAPGQVQLKRVSAFEYDPATGILNKEITEPDIAALTLKKTYTFDGFGNITRSSTSGVGVEPWVTSSIYDARGQFEIQTSNTLNQKEIRTYDPRHGKVASLKGPNGLTTSWTYDSFGRVVLETRADGTQSRTLNLMADSNSPANAKYFVRTDVSGMPPSIVYYDILDREIRKEGVGFDGRKILVDTEYNEKGETARSSDPYFSGGTPLWTVNSFDVISRPVEITMPGNRISTTTYNGLSTTVTNPLGQSNKRTVNCLGQIISSQDNLGKTIQYGYDNFGNLTKLTDSAGNITSMEYDIRGNKTKIIDLDTKTTTYTYDVLGQLRTQTNGKGQKTTLTYDKLSRLISRAEPEGTTTWIYDTQPMGIGKLSSVNSVGGKTETYAYDAFGRLSSTTTNISGTNYVTSQTYDDLGRVSKLTYPSGFAITNQYNSNGFLEKVINASSSQLYWQALRLNARGQLENQAFGNGLTTTRVYDSATGFLQTAQTGSVQNLAFTFDAIGNLTQRKDVLVNKTENFTYDQLNRLTQAQVTGQTALTMTYNDLGNITSMSGVGTYTYGQNGAGPHAVTAITGAKPSAYTYDANGNRISSTGGTVQYSSYNLPATITKGTKSLNFYYDAERNRFKQTFATSGTINKTKLYIGGIFETETAGSITKNTHFINTGDGISAIYTTETGKPVKTRYLHKDHLNSIQTITNETGATTEILSFDAWGNRRNATTWTSVSAPAKGIETDRGFTGHEQLDDVGLIHMNGRVYDPVIGRFLSADPKIQSPENIQNLNRYSYVLNNPLSYTDPSGFFFDKIFKAIANFFKENNVALLTAAVLLFAAPYLNVFAAQLVAGMGIQSAALQSVLTVSISGAMSGALGGVTSTVLSGGSFSDILKSGLKGALSGAISANLFFGGAEGLGHESEFGSPEHLAKIVAHGASGGINNLLQGGKMKHGFISSAFLATVSPGINQYVPKGAQGFSSVIVGGTVSELGGGKFANGAITAVFQRLYNDESEDKSQFIQDSENTNSVFEIIGLDIEATHISFPGSEFVKSVFTTFDISVNSLKFLSDMNYENGFDLWLSGAVPYLANPYLTVGVGGLKTGLFLGDTIGHRGYTSNELIGANIAYPYISWKYGKDIADQEMYELRKSRGHE